MSSAEERLLLATARTRLDADARERVRSLVDAKIDWDAFAGLVQRHRVVPVVYEALRRHCKEGVPEKILADLQATYLATTSRNLLCVRELVRLVEKFREQGIEIIPYKGPIVALEAYGELRLRQFNDLDFLVRKQDLHRVLDLLDEDGYRSGREWTQETRRVHEREEKEYGFWRGPFAIEPHWSITTRRFHFPIDYDALWRRAERQVIQDGELLTFSAEDALLVYCVVGSKGQWKRLQMICDIAESIRSHPQLDWDACLDRAQALGAERMLMLGITLAHDLLGAHPPREVLRRARTDTVIPRLTEKIRARLFKPRPSAERIFEYERRFSLLTLQMRERWRDKITYISRSLTTPTVVHLGRIPLPRQLSFLYRIIVPIYDYVIWPAARLAKAAWNRRPTGPSPLNR